MKKYSRWLYPALCCAILAAPIVVWGGGVAHLIRLHIADVLGSAGLHIDALSSSTRRPSSPARIADISTVDATVFDPRKGEWGMLTYRLSEPGWVRVRVVHQGQAHLPLRTLVNWEAREVGIHREPWDGRDASGNIVDPSTSSFLLATGEGIHGRHDWRQCGDLDVRIERPAASLAAVNGMYLFEISFTREGAALKEGTEYAVRLYVDYQHARIYRCTAQLADSFTFVWDSQEQPDGEHMITVVVDDGEDHMGTASRPVLVRNAALAAPLRTSPLGALVHPPDK